MGKLFWKATAIFLGTVAVVSFVPLPPQTVDTSAAQTSLVYGAYPYLKTSATAITSTPTDISLLSESIDARFVGMLSHVRWLIGQQPVTVRQSRGGSAVFDKQIESLADDFGNSLNGLREELQAADSALLAIDTITPDMVLSTSQTDEYCLTYEATGTTWEWQTCGAGGTGLATTSVDTSAKLSSIVTDETGSGALVFAGSPTLTGTLTAANANFSGNVGIGTATPESVLHVVSPSLGMVPKFSRVVSGASDVAYATARFVSVHEGVMADGFGTGFYFSAKDSLSGLDQSLGAIFARKSGGDNTGDITFSPSVAGAITERVRITSTGSLGIGTTTPNQRLTVEGNINLSAATGALYFDDVRYLYASSTNSSVVFGENAGTQFHTSTFGNIAIGYSAGEYASSSGSNNNVFLGSWAGGESRGSNNFFSGNSAGYLNTGSLNTVIGFSAAAANTGDSNNIFGSNAGLDNSGDSNNIFGVSSGRNNSGSNNNILGLGAAYGNTGSGSNFFGQNSGNNNSGDNNNFLSAYSGYNNIGVHNNLFGYNAGYNNNGSTNLIIGPDAGYNSIGSNNVIFGDDAGYNNTGNENFMAGSFAGYNSDGDYNFFTGYNAGRYIQGNANIALGAEALFGSHATSYLSNNNIALGYRAGYASANGSGNNILIGYQAADNLTTGNNNIIIGYDIDNITATTDNALNIGNLIFGTGLDGAGTTLSSGNIGVGTTSPYAKLSIQNTGTSNSLIVEDQANDTTPFVIDASGKVGVGTISPRADTAFNVESSMSDTLGFRNGITSHVNSTALADSTANLNGGNFYAQSEFNSPHNAGRFTGLYGAGYHEGVGTVTTLNGLWADTGNYNTGTVTNNSTLIVTADNRGLITNQKYISIESFGNTGTITNTYGLYLGDLTSGTQTNQPYSIYASDAGTRNYFAGSVGIGSTSPASKLTVSGTSLSNQPVAYYDEAYATMYAQESHMLTVSGLDGASFTKAFANVYNRMDVDGTGAGAAISNAVFDMNITGSGASDDNSFSSINASATYLGSNSTNSYVSGISAGAYNGSGFNVSGLTGIGIGAQNTTDGSSVSVSQYGAAVTTGNSCANCSVTDSVAYRATPFNNGNNSTITNMIGFGGYLLNSGTGAVVTNAYGAYVGAFNGATFTNTYGFYVGDITSGTQTNVPYSFYASDADTRNYFAGNVGIGTNDPQGKLDINGPSGVTSFTGTTPLGLRVRGSSGLTDYSGIDFSGNSDASAFPYARIAVITGGSGSSMQFGTSNNYASGVTNTALTINPAGNVGIGTTSPGAKLEIVGTIFPVMSAVRDTSITNDWRSAVALTHRSSGDMVDGFGTELSFRIADSAGVFNGIGNLGAVRDGSDNEGALTFRAGTNGLEEFMRITSSGNVGIGTTTPAQKLQVFGNIRVGTTGSNGCLENYGGGVIGGTCSSDERLKEDVVSLASSTDRSYLASLAALTPVVYNWNEDAVELYKKDGDMENIGLIAQDVQQVFPELVSENSDGYKQVNFTSLTFYIIEAMKEVWQKIQGHDERLNELEQENEYLKTRLDRIEGELNVAPPPAPAPISEPSPEPALEVVAEPVLAPEPSPAPESTPEPGV